jgi:hypothetical protein
MSELGWGDFFEVNFSKDLKEDIDHKLALDLFSNNKNEELYDKSSSLDNYLSDPNISTQKSSNSLKNKQLVQSDSSAKPKEGLEVDINSNEYVENKAISKLQERKPKVDNMKRMYLTKLRKSLHLTILRDILKRDKTKFQKIPDGFKNPNYESVKRIFSFSLTQIYSENYIDQIKSYTYNNEELMKCSIKEWGHRYFNHINFVSDLYELSQKLTKKQFSSNYIKEYLISYISIVKSLIGT